VHPIFLNPELANFILPHVTNNGNLNEIKLKRNNQRTEKSGQSSRSFWKTETRLWRKSVPSHIL